MPRWRVVLSLAIPFLLALGYFAFAISGYWIPTVGCVVALSFVTFGSVSHDLVHRSLGLSKFWNEAFLTAIEMLMLRSGRAYRLSHLNHHARYPHGDDPEGAAAHGSLFRALLSGPTYFAKLWIWCFRLYPAHRRRLALEATVALLLAGIAIAISGITIIPLVYVALVYCGTWVVPLATSFIPHTPQGRDSLTQTRRFRGMLARLIAFDHLYHLEHHLYPAVPHQHWRELALRLDPYLDRAGVPVVRIGLPSEAER